MKQVALKRYRVIQWGTGNAGRKANGGIVLHPDLELVGVHPHWAAKVGRDSAELGDLCRILAAGKNVVNTVIVSRVYPPFASPKLQ